MSAWHLWRVEPIGQVVLRCPSRSWPYDQLHIERSERDGLIRGRFVPGNEITTIPWKLLEDVYLKAQAWRAMMGDTFLIDDFGEVELPL